MQNSIDQLSIPRDSIVVDYVAGRLSEHARQQFEAKLVDDPELVAAVEFEYELVEQMQQVAKRNQRSASDQFPELLERIEMLEGLTSTDTKVHPIKQEATARSTVTRRNSWPLSIAASVLFAGVIATLAFKPLQQQFLTPSFQGLSAPDSISLDLPSLVSESRIAKLTLAIPLENQRVAELLAGYQLELVSQVPEQSALIVLAQKPIVTNMLSGWRNDNRIVDAELVALNVEKK